MPSTDNVMFAGIDGFDIRLADYYEHPFWEEHRDEMTVVSIPKPDLIEEGQIATASSPRLWARIYTGCGPHTNGILGFWEFLDQDGNAHAAEWSLDKIREERCEKLVNSTHLLVPPIWDIVLRNRHSIGLTTPWFSYPMKKDFLSDLFHVGKWALADFPFPRDSDRMSDELLFHPPDAEPPDNFQEEVGAGARVSILVEEDPQGFYEDLLLQDRDRYEYTVSMLDHYGTPNFCTTLTRSVDGMAHQFRKEEDIRGHYPPNLRDGVDNLRQVYDVNFNGIADVWGAGEFDHLVIGGDHQCGLRMEDGKPVFVGDDHEWPAKFVILSDDLPSQVNVEARYEDILPTILDLMGLDVPQHVEGQPIGGMASREEKLRDLGYRM